MRRLAALALAGAMLGAGKGDRTTVSVVVPAAGQALVFYCKYHRDEGMRGALYSTA